MDMTWPKVVAGRQAGAPHKALPIGIHEPIEIAVTSDLRELESEWRRFQSISVGTFFQTFEWCEAWVETVGKHLNAKTLIVTGRYEDGNLAFLLPLCLRRSAGIRIIEWIATGQSNYGFGLFDPNFLPGSQEWFSSHGWTILRSLPRADVLYLRDMPEHLYGFAHPMTGWFSFAGANSSYIMELEKDYEALYSRKRSATSRRGNRKRDNKLFSLAGTSFGLPTTPDETQSLIKSMFGHQEHRLSESGVSKLFNKHEKNLIHRLANPDVSPPVLLPYHLKVEGELSAMMLGGYFADTYWALISSLAPGDARKHSPGDAALRRTIQACCERGLTTFDFSSGDMPYKQQWADQSIRLHETVRILTWRGLPWALAYTAALLLKRMIKRSPVLWSTAIATRKLLASVRR